MTDVDTVRAPRPHLGEVVVGCPEPLGPTIDRLLQLDFVVRSIMPADRPRRAVLEGHGTRLCLDTGVDAPGLLRLPAAPDGTAGREVLAGGLVIEFVTRESAIVVPPLREEFVVTRAPCDDETSAGRAGMRYRDLLPSRLGGRFIASHISIPAGGPVPDYVHFHHVRFQMIHCHRGWVTVQYEDQGDLITMRAGDTVLQPSTIRHRVIEASPGAQVVEIGCPAEHETCGDPETVLPTGRVDPSRAFGPDGHRFVHHCIATATWRPSTHCGFECTEAPVADATQGLAAVRVLRPASSPSGDAVTGVRHDGELWFGFVLEGSVSLHTDADGVTLAAGDAVAVPADQSFRWASPSPDLRLLEVELPAGAARRAGSSD